MNTNYSARATISASPYTAPKSGICYISVGKKAKECTITVDGQKVAYMRGSDNYAAPCATVIIGKNQQLTYTYAGEAYFVPFN